MSCRGCDRCVSVKYLVKRMTWGDFEDSVQYSVALLQEMDGIVTRNEDDFEKSEVKVWRPEELLSFV